MVHENGDSNTSYSNNGSQSNGVSRITLADALNPLLNGVYNSSLSAYNNYENDVMHTGQESNVQNIESKSVNYNGAFESGINSYQRPYSIAKDGRVIISTS